MPTQSLLTADKGRTYRQVERDRIRNMLEQDRYEIWVKSESGVLYEPECEWPDKTSRARALARLGERLDDAEYVFYIQPLSGVAHDLSEDFAALIVRDLHESGTDFHAHDATLPRFVAKHLTWRQVFEEIAE